MEMLNFFSNLFYLTRTCQPEMALETIHCLVIEDMNKELLAEFTENEVKVTLNQMAPLKASGLDGMPPLFY